MNLTETTIAMAKYRKTIMDKAINSLDGYDRVLYNLGVLKLDDVTVYDELYNYGATACFSLNWFNPLTWFYALYSFIIYLIFYVAKGTLRAIADAKKPVITTFD